MKINHNWHWVSDLMPHVFHPERFQENGDPKPDVWLPYEYTRSEYVAVDRAIRTLEQQGLVESKVEPYTWRKGEGWIYYYGRRAKHVKISQAGLAKCCSQN